MAVYNVTGLEVWNSAVSHPDGIMIPMGATLRLEAGANIDTRNIMVMGTLQIGEPTNRITDINNPVKIKLEGNTLDNGDRQEGFIMTMDGGSIEVNGANASELTSWTRLTTDALIGATSITLDDITGWQVGGIIAIAPSTMYGWESEERVITAIDPVTKTVSFTDPLIYNHSGGRNNFAFSVGTHTKVANASCEVAYVSRAVEVYTNPGDTYGAHCMFMSGSTVQIEGLQCSYLGMTTPSPTPYTPGGDIGGIVRVDDSPTGKGRPGRYSLHFHENGDNYTAFIKNSSLYHSRHKGYVIHDTNGVLVEDCTSYKGVSHQISIGEDGTEKDITIRRCCLIYPKRLYNFNDPDGPTGNDAAFDVVSGGSDTNLTSRRISSGTAQNEVHPGAFWFCTPHCTIEDNVVAGGVGVIAYYFDFVFSRPARNGIVPLVALQEDVKDPANLTFRNNTFHSLTPEGGHLFGSYQDVNVDTPCNNRNTFGFSYRSAGVGIWFDEYSPEFSQYGGRLPRSANMKKSPYDSYILENTFGYNTFLPIWSESSACHIKNFGCFHFKVVANMLGGCIEDAVFNNEDLLGVLGVTAKNTNPAIEAGLTDSSNHYEGFYLADSGGVAATTARICTEYFDQEGITIMNAESIGGSVKLAKQPLSFNKVSIKGTGNFIRIAQAFEGPAYLSNWTAVDVIDPIVVDENQGIAYYAPGAGGSSYTPSAAPKRYDSNNQRNGALMDLDNNVIYFINGTTSTASSWVFVRINAIENAELGIITAKADGAATFYDTNQLQKFPGSTDPGFDKSCTLIMQKGSSETYTTTTAHIVDVYGYANGDTVTLNGVNYSYSANEYRDPFNTLYLTNSQVQPPAGSTSTITDNVIYKAVKFCGNTSCTTVTI